MDTNILQIIYIIFTVLGVISYNLTGYYTNNRAKKIAIENNVRSTGLKTEGNHVSAELSEASFCGHCGKDLKTENSYSWTKLARTFMTGGFASLIATVVAYSAQNFEPQYVVLSFVNGAIFCAGIDKLEDMGKKKADKDENKNKPEKP